MIEEILAPTKDTVRSNFCLLIIFYFFSLFLSPVFTLCSLFFCLVVTLSSPDFPFFLTYVALFVKVGWKQMLEKMKADSKATAKVYWILRVEKAALLLFSLEKKLCSFTLEISAMSGLLWSKLLTRCSIHRTDRRSYWLFCENPNPNVVPDVSYTRLYDLWLLSSPPKSFRVSVKTFPTWLTRSIRYQLFMDVRPIRRLFIFPVREVQAPFLLSFGL